MAGPLKRFRSGRENLEGAVPGLKGVFAPRLLAEREQTNRAVSALFAEEGALSRFAPETQDEIQFQASQPMTREQHRQFRSSLSSLAQSQLEWGWNLEAAQEQLRTLGGVFGAVAPVLPSGGVDGARTSALARQLQGAWELAELDPERAVAMADEVRAGLDGIMDETRALREKDRSRYQDELDDIRQVHRDARSGLERALSPLVNEARRQAENPAWLGKQADKWLVASVLDAANMQVVRNETGRLGLSFGDLGWKNDPSEAPDMTNAQLLRLGAEHAQTLQAQEARENERLVGMLEQNGFGFTPGETLRVEDIISSSYQAASSEIADMAAQFAPAEQSTTLAPEPSPLMSLANTVGEAVLGEQGLESARGLATDAMEAVAGTGNVSLIDRARAAYEKNRAKNQARMRELQREMIH